MVLYAFVLGRKYLLSLAELLQVLPPRTPIIEFQPEVLIVALPQPFPKPQQILDRLGGTLQIVEIMAEHRTDDEVKIKDALLTILEQSMVSKAEQDSEALQTSKLLYALSAFSLHTPSHQILKKFLNLTKVALNEREISSRYLNNKTENPHNAVVAEEKLVDKGTALVVIEGRFKTFVGKTVALQDFSDYSYRDFNRPARDARLGMLPPKLAQIMINLAGLASLYDGIEKLKPLTVFDPFAGVGTVVTEALRFGYSVIASDIKPEVMMKAEKNIAWTRERYFTHGQKIEMFVHDATTLTPDDVGTTVDAIVTESYLGPPLSELPPHAVLQKNLRSSEELILRFLRAAAQLLQPGAPLIVTTPVYRLPEGFMRLEALPQLAQKFGYQLIPLIPKKVRQDHTALFAMDQGVQEFSLIYDRADQLVGREVWKLQKR